MGVKYKSYKEDIIKKFLKLEQESLIKIGQFVEGKAILLAPVDTGDLRKSITFDVDKTAVRVGVLKGSKGADYALFVEKGTRFQKAQPYIEPAFRKYQNEIIALIEKEFKKL